jgi:hypothetical protein
LLERDSFDLLLPEFDKPWVIHLREICCCSTNLYTWRPNTVYKNRRMHRHQPPGTPAWLLIDGDEMEVEDEDNNKEAEEQRDAELHAAEVRVKAAAEAERVKAAAEVDDMSPTYP